MVNSRVEQPKKSDAFIKELDVWVVDEKNRTYDLTEYLHPDATLLSVSCESSIDDIYFRADIVRKTITVDIESLLDNGLDPNGFFISKIKVGFQGKEFWRVLFGDLGELALHIHSKWSRTLKQTSIKDNMSGVPATGGGDPVLAVG